VRRQDVDKCAGKRVYLFFLSLVVMNTGRVSGKEKKVTELKDSVAEGFPSSPLWTHGQARG
jgi:hypothetical protein